MTIEIRIDPTRCRGHAICALMYSEGVELDRWGYGRVVDGTPEGRRSIKRALRAAAACPNGAVLVEDLADRRIHLAERGPDGG
jgi:ferredoxin